jgi:hypothetical protein
MRPPGRKVSFRWQDLVRWLLHAKAPTRSCLCELNPIRSQHVLTRDGPVVGLIAARVLCQRAISIHGGVHGCSAQQSYACRHYRELWEAAHRFHDDSGVVLSKQVGSNHDVDGVHGVDTCRKMVYRNSTRYVGD